MSSEQPRAILFDMDDTILAYDAVAEPVWQDVCRRFAPRIAGLRADTLYATLKEMRTWFSSDPERRRKLRLNLEWGRRQVVSLSVDRLGIRAPELANEMADSYNIERERATFVLPGAIDTLKRYKDMNMRLALLTNGSSRGQREKIERFGLSPFFDFVVIEEEFGCGKPDERVFLNALKKLNVTSSEAWMVGDDLERDIEGAKNVGIFGIWVDWRGGGLSGSGTIKPDRIIRTISELI